MKFYLYFPFLIFIFHYSTPLYSQSDTISGYDIDDVTVVSLTKETRKLLHFPSSISYVKSQKIEQLGITSLKELTSYFPNFYMPDYGTRATSSIYMRGLGSRVNNPAVGIYVDNVPLLDKSTFDFELRNIERIEVLRGPQGTLYGRNTLGGLINITTISPFKHKGLRAEISYGSYNQFKGNITLSHSYKDKVALSVSGGFEQHSGFFKNEFDTINPKNKNIDYLNSYTAQIKLVWYILPNFKLDLTTNGQLSQQGGYPYRLKNSLYVNYNDPSFYNRDLATNSLYLEYRDPLVVISSATSYQYSGDDMQVDQDFTPADIFTLNQKQHQHAVTQEFLVKSTLPGNYQYTFGAMGMYQNLGTGTLVEFKKDFLSTLQKKFPSFITITDTLMSVPGDFKTTTVGAALFHQSTYDNLFIDNLSATLGIRVDFEQTRLDYQTNSEMNVSVLLRDPPIASSAKANVEGADSTYFIPVLPKFSLSYVPSKRCFLFGNISRGYSSGGFNIQRFGDIISQKIQEKGAEISGRTIARDTISVADQIIYKPEYSWNFEVGTRSELIADKLFLDLTYFFILSTDKQVSVFAPSGLGRMTLNSAQAQSQGMECVLSGTPVKNFWLSANYGFTHAVFTKHDNGKPRADNAYKNFAGNYIPFSPRHTLSLRGDYTLNIFQPWLESLKFAVQYNAIKDIFWNEENTLLEPFYGVLNAQVWYKVQLFSFGLWGRNLFNAKYHAFCFESLGNTFVQQGKPLQLGFTLLLHI